MDQMSKYIILRSLFLLVDMPIQSTLTQGLSCRAASECPRFSCTFSLPRTFSPNPNHKPNPSSNTNHNTNPNPKPTDPTLLTVGLQVPEHQSKYNSIQELILCEHYTSMQQSTVRDCDKHDGGDVQVPPEVWTLTIASPLSHWRDTPSGSRSRCTNSTRKSNPNRAEGEMSDGGSVQGKLSVSPASDVIWSLRIWQPRTPTPNLYHCPLNFSDPTSYQTRSVSSLSARWTAVTTGGSSIFCGVRLESC